MFLGPSPGRPQYALHVFCCHQINSHGHANELPLAHFQHAFVEAFVHMLVDRGVVLGKEGHSTDWTARRKGKQRQPGILNSGNARIWCRLSIANVILVGKTQAVSGI
jgi:hypothetical protein